VSKLKVEWISPAKLRPNPRNPRRNDKAVTAVKASIKEFGFNVPILVDDNLNIVAGHTRYKAARALKLKAVPSIRLSHLSPAELKAFGIADNRTAELSAWDFPRLAEMLNELKLEDTSLLDSTGFDSDAVELIISGPVELGEGQEAGPDREHISLIETFGIPPFSVFDARQGYWQRRKKAWISLGVRSEIGRQAAAFDQESLNRIKRKAGRGKASNALGYSVHVRNPDFYRGKTKAEKVLGRRLSNEEYSLKYFHEREYGPYTGTSIFDPVLCEILYSWFCPPDGAVLDPFAGGSVRGIVAAALGRRYTAVDLSEEQINANRQQWSEIKPRLARSLRKRAGSFPPPEWIIGDSAQIHELAPGAYDFVFSCPPYFDLERYSKDPRDLSNMRYEDFLEVYRKIIAGSLSMLKADRFACFVVGEIRDRKGFYRNFVGETVRAFWDAGAVLYNEAVLITMAMTVGLRSGKQFKAGRKLGKTHQNVLVFCKGDPRRACKACGDINVTLPEEIEGEEGSA